MHIHILGICGTFMGSLAQLAKQSGMRVTGCDANVYPPMSTQLEQAGIELMEGFDAGQLDLNPPSSPAPARHQSQLSNAYNVHDVCIVYTVCMGALCTMYH